MEATVANFRKSMHAQKNNHMVLYLPGVTDREKAKAMIGKSVVWKSPAGKEIKGKISQVHGNKGAVRAIFEKGMPGQAVGARVLVS